MILSDDEKKTTAYHEAGHALVARLLPGTDPVHKVSIIPRGMALGVTMQLPDDDRHNYSRSYLEKTLAVLMAGRVAEEIIFDQLTTGAGNDIERATKMARKMVCQWGMSDTLGPLSLGENNDHVFLGREIAHHKDYSEQTAQVIDGEIKGFVTRAHGKAKQLLEKNIDVLHAVAGALLERETITGADITLLMKGEPLPPMSPTLAKPVRKEAETMPEAASGTGFGDDKGGGEKEAEAERADFEQSAKPSESSDATDGRSEDKDGADDTDDADEFALEEPDKTNRS